jgi:hypothetical protein
MAYKEQKFMSHHSGGWEVQPLDTGRFSVSELKALPSGEEFSWASFRRALVPLIRAPPP